MRLAEKCLYLLSVVVAMACTNSEDKRRTEELALKERELALRERELAAKTVQAPNPGDVAAAVVSPPNPPVTDQGSAKHAKPQGGPAAAAANPATATGPQDVVVTIVVNFDQTKLDGKPWDVGADAAAPDPFFTTRVSSTGATWSSPLGKDAFTVNGTTKMSLNAGDSVAVAAYDKDLFSKNDAGGTFIAAFAGKSAMVKGRGGAVAFSVTFQTAM